MGQLDDVKKLSEWQAGRIRELESYSREQAIRIREMELVTKEQTSRMRELDALSETQAARLLELEAFSGVQTVLNRELEAFSAGQTNRIRDARKPLRRAGGAGARTRALGRRAGRTREEPRELGPGAGRAKSVRAGDGGATRRAPHDDLASSASSLLSVSNRLRSLNRRAAARYDDRGSTGSRVSPSRVNRWPSVSRTNATCSRSACMRRSPTLDRVHETLEALRSQNRTA